MAALVSAVAALAGTAPAASADHGITLLASQRLDSRLLDLTLSTPALATPTHVRVLLPARYREQKPRRYPVLYLLHGSFDDYRSWTDKGAVESITGHRKLIVVMPDGGQGGWYTNWVNRGQGGPPEWETFHIQQLIPWIDDRYRADRSRGARGIAGLSMGGFGAMTYAARHPDLFSWAGSFSGAVDIVNYAPVAVVIDTGNGQPGPLDPPGRPFDPIENGVETMSVSLHQRLLSLGIPHTWDDYGPGIHSWPYWQRDLIEALPSVMRTFNANRRVKRRHPWKSWPASPKVPR